jgi:hypothetical protein
MTKKTGKTVSRENIQKITIIFKKISLNDYNFNATNFGVRRGGTAGDSEALFPRTLIPSP